MSSTYWNRINAGLCGFCGIEKPRAGKRSCEDCAKLLSYYGKKRYRQLKQGIVLPTRGRPTEYHFYAARDGITVRGTCREIAAYLGIHKCHVYAVAKTGKETRDGFKIYKGEKERP